MSVEVTKTTTDVVGGLHAKWPSTVHVVGAWTRDTLCNMVAGIQDQHHKNYRDICGLRGALEKESSTWATIEFWIKRIKKVSDKAETDADD